MQECPLHNDDQNHTGRERTLFINDYEKYNVILTNKLHLLYPKSRKKITQHSNQEVYNIQCTYLHVPDVSETKIT